jgi:hypothetical protein
MFKISLPRIKVSRTIQATPEEVWDMLTDTECWTEWGPTVKAVRSETRYIQTGSTGYVKTVFGFWAPFVITEWAHRQYWSWHVFNIRATGHRIEMIDSGCCRLIFEVPLWAAPYAVICQIAVARIARILKAGDSTS